MGAEYSPHYFCTVVGCPAVRVTTCSSSCVCRGGCQLEFLVGGTCLPACDPRPAPCSSQRPVSALLWGWRSRDQGAVFVCAAQFARFVCVSGLLFEVSGSRRLDVVVSFGQKGWAVHCTHTLAVCLVAVVVARLLSIRSIMRAHVHVCVGSAADCAAVAVRTVFV